MTPEHDYSSEDATQQYRDDATSPNTNAEQVLAGTTVFSANGEQLGTVSERGFENDMLVMRHGGGDLYIPIAAITSTGTSGIFTTLRPEDLGKLRNMRAAARDQRRANAATDQPRREPYDLDVAEDGARHPDVQT
jgi:hypothetical protein